jgi:uncharacterized protein YjfI (DUF2170 family)
MVDIVKLARDLEKLSANSEDDFNFKVVTTDENELDDEIIHIYVQDMNSFPIFISETQDKILCLSYLFDESLIKPDKVNNVNKALLSANMTISLSSFALLDDQYVVFGALPIDSSPEAVIDEIKILHSNTIDTIETMQDFLSYDED